MTNQDMTITDMVFSTALKRIGYFSPRSIWFELKKVIPTVKLKTIQRILHRLSGIFRFIQRGPWGRYWIKVDKRVGESPDKPIQTFVNTEGFEESGQGEGPVKWTRRNGKGKNDQKPRTVRLIAPLPIFAMDAPTEKVDTNVGEGPGRNYQPPPQMSCFLASEREMDTLHIQILLQIYDNWQNDIVSYEADIYKRIYRDRASDKPDGNFRRHIRELQNSGYISVNTSSGYQNPIDLTGPTMGLVYIWFENIRTCAPDGRRSDGPAWEAEVEQLTRNDWEVMNQYPYRNHDLVIKVDILDRPEDEIIELYLAKEFLGRRHWTVRNPKAKKGGWRRHHLKDLTVNYDITTKHILVHPMNGIWADTPENGRILAIDIAEEAIKEFQIKMNKRISALEQELQRTIKRFKMGEYNVFRMGDMPTLQLTKGHVARSLHPIATTIAEVPNAIRLMQKVSDGTMKVDQSEFIAPVSGRKLKIPELETEKIQDAPELLGRVEGWATDAGIRQTCTVLKGIATGDIEDPVRVFKEYPETVSRVDELGARVSVMEKAMALDRMMQEVQAEKTHLGQLIKQYQDMIDGHQRDRQIGGYHQ